ncbi:hypothetical protein Bsp3421_002857 [Burkholderia sp. FERM BP-3421]|uniref:hypothetical protein n=1 Tax=Burkholderia sp. FERM BP-3421 TaxID=1494466 RepID=UPI002361BBB9|nr:hypothetical protein [Burkholderia sp. FERM BP-3421]WDD92825.1 hypothetical protein Bsp3421_002857 [Burkholderia sp. FERM BP-3421]
MYKYSVMAPMNAGAKQLDDELVVAMRASIEIVSILPPELAPTGAAAEAVLEVRIAITRAVRILPSPGGVFLAKFERDLMILRDSLKKAADKLNREIVSRV